jgi:hypothetical protein
MSADIPYRRLLAASAIVFVLLLAFMAGRVRAGSDPAQASTRPAISAPADEGFPGQALPDDTDPPSTRVS